MGDRLASVLGSNPQNQIFKNLFKTIQINCKSPLNALLQSNVQKLYSSTIFRFFFSPKYHTIICSCVYVPIISVCSVAQNAVLWLPTRMSGVQFPRFFWNKKINTFSWSSKHLRGGLFHLGLIPSQPHLLRWMPWETCHQCRSKSLFG